MRELDLGPGVTTRKSRNLLDTLMSFDHLDSPLLPNLRKLVCFEPTMGKYLRPFLQRSLTAFYWRYDGTPYTAALLETLRKADPALKILHLLPSSMKACKQAISVAMERVFQATHHLQYAAVLPTGNTLKHLSLLSSVTRLRLEVYGTADYPAYFSLSPSATNFCQLLELTVVAPLDSHISVCNFLKGVSSLNLRVLRLSFEPSSQDLNKNSRDSRNIANSYRQIINRCSNLSTLKILVVGLGTSFSRSVRVIEDPERFLSDDAITPLFRLHSLVTLDLQDLPLSISPSCIQQVVQNWPDIRTLYLGSNSSDTVHTQTTLSDLRLFVPCARLEYLGLAVAQPAQSHLDGFAAGNFDSDSVVRANLAVRQLSLRVFTRALAKDERYMNGVLACAFPAACVLWTRGPRASGYSFRP